MATIFAALEEHNPNIVEVTVVDAEREVQEHDTDVVEQLVEINEGMDAVSEAFVAIESMMTISDNFKKSIAEEKGISLEAATIAKISTEHICNILGYPIKKPIVPALEAFNPQTGLEATKYALEGLGDFLMETWEAILKFFQDVKDYIKKLWNGIFSANERKKNLIGNYMKKLEQMEEDNWEPLDNADAKKRFENNKNRVLSLQNSFRIKDRDIIEKNVIDILNNQRTITGSDMEKVIEAVTIDKATGALDVSKSTKAMFAITSKIDPNTFIDGWMLVNETKKGRTYSIFKQNVKKKSSINSMNNRITDISDMKLWLDRCLEIIENMDESSENYKDYEDMLDDYISYIKDLISNNKSTMTAAEKSMLDTEIDNIKFVKGLVDLVFVKMPSLAAATISKTLDLVGFQMSFYQKSKD